MPNPNTKGIEIRWGATVSDTEIYLDGQKLRYVTFIKVEANVNDLDNLTRITFEYIPMEGEAKHIIKGRLLIDE